MAEARRKTTFEERKEIVDYCIDNGPTEGFWGIIKSKRIRCTKSLMRLH